MIKLFISIAVIFSVLQCAAQSGLPDNSFGTGGKVITAVGSGNDVGSSIAVQTDGKLIVSGNAYNGSNFDFALVRYNTNGTLDNTFGTGGKIITAIGTATEVGNSVAIQGDGKIVVAGYSFTGSNADFAVARYNSNGTLDNTFGTGGKIVTAVGTGADFGYSAGIQSDGKIVVAGNSFNGSNSDFALVRYNSNGTLDNTFGTGGKVVTAIGLAADYAYSLAIQGDGKLVAGGWSNNGTTIDFALVRYNSNGSLDNSFGSSGVVTTAGGAIDNYGCTLAIQKDGKIVLSGGVTNGSKYDFGTKRFNADGSVDNTFGSAGIVVTAIGGGDDDPKAVIIQRDGKIVVAGDSYNGTNYDFALVRYNINGTLDNTFGVNGKVTYALGAGSDYINAIALQSDDKIVVAGYTANGTNDDVALMRYTNLMTGIDRARDPSVQWIVTPNPGNGIFTIRNSGTTEVKYGIQIVNLLGETIYSISNNTISNLEIDISNYPKGMYLVTINDGNSVCTIKMVSR